MKQEWQDGIKKYIQDNASPELFREFRDKLQCDINNSLKLDMHRINYLMKSAPWLPSIAEVVIFGTFITIIFIILDIVHSNYINNKVTKESRCLRKNSSGSVTAIDSNGKAMYTITYDKNNAATVTCDQKDQGIISNTYTNIKKYDPANPSTPQHIASTTCATQPFTANLSGQIYYTGDDLLVNYMQLDDKSYFTEARV